MEKVSCNPLLIKFATKMPCHQPNRVVRRKIKDLSFSQHPLTDPIRLQKILSISGIGSRRKIETMVKEGLVFINKQKAKLGQKITLSDEVVIDHKRIFLKWPHQNPRIVIYHKQEGEIVTKKDPQGRLSIFDRLAVTKKGRWVSIGRLDLNSSGLLILTTDGNLSQRFAHPRFEVEREYAVRVLGVLSAEQKAKLCEGITLKTGRARVLGVKEMSNHATATNRWYQVTLNEGKNREVRELFAALGFMVSRLIRIRFGPIELPSRLKRGQYYELNPLEVANIMKWAKLSLDK